MEKLKLWLPAAKGPSQLLVPPVPLQVITVLLQQLRRLPLLQGASS